MCLSCGCGAAQDDHGDKRNITASTLQDAAEAANISVDEVRENIEMGIAGEAEMQEAD